MDVGGGIRVDGCVWHASRITTAIKTGDFCAKLAAMSKKSKKLQPEQLYELHFIADPQLNHDASQALAVHTRIDQTHIDQPDNAEQPTETDSSKAPRYLSQIYLYDVAEGSSRPLTSGESSSHSPRFSPDGSRIAFLSKRHDDKATQLYLLHLAGGEAQRLSNLEQGVSEFCWHPSGETIAFCSRGDEKTPKCEVARRIDTLHYRMDGSGFRSPFDSAIYMLNVARQKHKIYKLEQHHLYNLNFSGDGRYLFFHASTQAQRLQQQGSIYRLTFSTGNIKRKAIVSQKYISGVSSNADGSRLAYYGSSPADSFANPTGLWLCDGTMTRQLSDADVEALPSTGGDSHYGRLSNPITWLDDHTLLINPNQAGRSGLASLNLDDGTLRPWQTGDRVVSAFMHQAGQTLFIAETPEQPAELFVRDADGNERQLSFLNQRLLERYSFGSLSKEKSLKAEDGTLIPYWLIQPEKPRKDNALVLQVHGGPHTNYGYGFYFEFHLLASQGYTVVYGNPRGGSSYGHEFQTTILQRYGTVDAADVMGIARKARKKHADGKAPMHLTGGSYGGFMTNWLVGQEDSKDFFRSAVTQRSIANWLSFFGTADIGYFFTPVQQGGNPWADTDTLWQQSPLKYVANVETPLLLIHAEKDYRCPIGQAEEFFAALRSLDKEAACLRIPDEGHNLSRSGRPDRRVARLEAIVEWFNNH